jgi:hypothetical protein
VVVRIEDREGGAEGYTFEITWAGDSRGGSQDRGSGYQDRGAFPGYSDRDRTPYAGDGRFTTEQAVRVCQDAVRQEGWNRFHSRDMYFRQTRIDDNPGRNDWVVGFFDVHPGNGPERRYRFSCSVDFRSGRVRSVNMEPLERQGEAYRSAPDEGGAALENCRRAVADRIRGRGYGRVEFNSVRIDDSRGRRDWVTGTLRAEGPRNSESFDFSCSVNLETGAVRSVDLNRR